MTTTTTTRGVSEAMVAELIAAGDFLAMNGTDGMVRRWERAKAALSAEPAAQGGEVIGYITADNLALLKSDDGSAFGHMTAPIYSRARSSREIPLYAAPPAQPDSKVIGDDSKVKPGERVPEGWRDDVALAAQMMTWGWADDGGLTTSQMDEISAHQAKLFAMLTASPAPSEGGKGVAGLCIRNPAPNAAAPSTALSPTATVYLNAKAAR